MMKMSSPKVTGSYYTPTILSDFLVKHVINNYITDESFSVLEPSCGDGQFVKAFKVMGSDKKIDLTLLDINKKELEKADRIVKGTNRISIKTHHGDFLEWFDSNERKFSLIIGNPPYIKKDKMDYKQIQMCERVDQVARDFSPIFSSKNKIKNIWLSFVKASMICLKDDGVLCLVLPSEILHVNYTKELREFISKEFSRVEIFAFNELIFPGIQQDVVALIASKRTCTENKQGVSFYQVNKLQDLLEPRFTEKFANIHRKNLDKWSNYILSDHELNFISELRDGLNTINDLSEKAEVGIVTAANDFFINSHSELRENNLTRSKNYIKPILQKGVHVRNLLKFNSSDLDELVSKDVKTSLLAIPEKPYKKLPQSIKSYLDYGTTLELDTRYKMTKRRCWYTVPSIWISRAMFIKRCHDYPKFFLNEANVLATDSFYRVNPKKGIAIEKLVFSFYNSLTFVLSELEGRYYGGGVLELTPSEFKNLAVPYNVNLTQENIEHLDRMLRENRPIKEILEFTNPILLPNVDYNRLESIRENLTNRRLKNENNGAILGSEENQKLENKIAV